ncbi:copper resistance protein CopC [Sphingomonas sanxanigenens]|uniref:CopC domain-containing protein n=1 Tax=Sphingomonas sanxanigenens DSM 19645 = NX02 TaxID=1123269 RepID=W0AFD5_9SPHN|nr:copper resistance protein CopC [Sphingomonas sanxanigenens]AHE56604.1 hypothetical protein NX02_24985 [Sphingomonas sanxanigenens DSM 19645 = NX02]
MTLRAPITAALLAASVLAPAAAIAQPRLVAATPAANAAVARTASVTLNFSERLAPGQSSATLVMTGMPGMANHPDMKMPGVTTSVSKDGKALLLTSAKPIPTGTYRVDYVVVGADRQRIAGKHSFSIR